MYTKVPCWAGLLIGLFFCLPLNAADPATRGLARQIVGDTGEQLTLYSHSHALLIGNMHYQHWEDLPQIEAELKQVAAALSKQGFVVHQEWDLDGENLKKHLSSFLIEYGAGAQNLDNRLVIYYSGHGETRDGLSGSNGYLVPVDAPQRKDNDNGFMQKALDMDDIVNWSKKIETKHVLFLFDSCFSGSILKTRSGSAVPENIKDWIKHPVRKFLTAGSANETVPASSAFTPAFIRGINEGAADLTGDGYITGSELSLYLAQEVPKYTQPANHPQEGQFGNGRDREGDVIFRNLADSPSPVKTQPLPPPMPELITTPLGYLQITVNSEGASIEVDGQKYPSSSIGKALNINDLNVGQHHLKVSKPGYLSYEKTVTLSANQWEQVPVILRALPPEVADLPAAAPPLATAPRLQNYNFGIEMLALPSGIKLGKYEVTQAQWRAVMGSNPSKFTSCGDDCPVEMVSWNDVQEFIQRLNQQTGQRYRLPTEDEWYTACQAGDIREYCGSNSIDSVAWYYSNSGTTTHPVGRKQANAWGLYDMSGNVLEFTSTCYEGDCARRVLRGGSWAFLPEFVRAAFRTWNDVTNRDSNIGFRLAQDR